MKVSAPSVLRLLFCAAFLILPTATVFAQGDYTAALPSVEKVKAQIKGTDPTDTLARQVAVFEYLQAYIQRIKFTRDYRGPYSPGELKLLTDYAKAQYDLSQGYSKSHTPEEVTAFNHLEGKYSINNALGWIKQLEGKEAADTYKGTEAELAASSKRFHDKIQKDLAPDPSAASHTLNAQGLSNDPTAVATRRCLELGGEALACTGKSFVGGLMNMVTGGSDLSELTGPSRSGVVLSGLYGRGPGTSISFSNDSASLEHCGVLEPESAPYSIHKNGASVQVTLAISPTPITLTMHPDGSFTGPGPITLNGRIITGYTTTTSTAMVNGAPAAAQGYYCNGPCTTTTSTPIYAPKTDRCTVAHLAAPPPPAPEPAAQQDSGLLGGLTSFISTIASGSLPGLRMEGKYSTGSAMLLDFQGDAVTLDCGAAHIKAPYTVENAPTQFLVHIKNSGGPFTLAVGSDHMLHGSGSTAINGRLVTGMRGEDITFVPHSETCEIGNFSPKGVPNSTKLAATDNSEPTSALASIPPSRTASRAGTATAAEVTPAAPLSTAATVTPASSVSTSSPAASDGPRAAFRVLLGSSFSGTNPLVGQSVFVMRKPLDQVLRDSGVSVPPNSSAVQAMKALQEHCRSPQACSSAIAGLRASYVTGTKLDASGASTLSATTTTGQYYFFVVAPPTNGVSLLWDVPVNLVAGDNKVTFTDANAQRMQAPATASAAPTH